MEITIADIEKYLKEVKTAVRQGRYRIEINSNRLANQDLFMYYVIVVSFHKQRYDLKYKFK